MSSPANSGHLPSPYAPSALEDAEPVELPVAIVATLLVDACLWMTGDDGVRPTRYDVGAGAWVLAFSSLRARSAEVAREIEQQLAVLCSPEDLSELVELEELVNETGGLRWSHDRWVGLDSSD